MGAPKLGVLCYEIRNKDLDLAQSEYVDALKVFFLGF